VLLRRVHKTAGKPAGWNVKRKRRASRLARPPERRAARTLFLYLHQRSYRARNGFRAFFPAGKNASVPTPIVGKGNVAVIGQVTSRSAVLPVGPITLAALVGEHSRDWADHFKVSCASGKKHAIKKHWSLKGNRRSHIGFSKFNCSWRVLPTSRYDQSGE